MIMESIRTNKAISNELSHQGYSLVAADVFCISTHFLQNAEILWNSWNWLEPDLYLKGTNIFRYRRYGKFKLNPESKTLRPQLQSTYYQSLDHNTYAGGITRKFSPLQPEIFSNQFLHALILHDYSQLGRKHSRNETCDIGVHQMRVIARQGHRGEPTPEGIHRDGHDFNVIHFVNKKNILGGESRIYDNNEILLARSFMRTTLDSIYLDDPRVLHDVSPVYQEDTGLDGYRDIMTINFEFK
jgi:hypothetical protein